MPKETLVSSHYLVFDACALIGRHAVMAGLGGLLFFGALFALLRRRFGRGGADIALVALFLMAVALFSAVCVYLLATRPGYRVFHPGF